MAEKTTAAKAPTLVFILRGRDAADEGVGVPAEVPLPAELVGDEEVTVVPKPPEEVLSAGRVLWEGKKETLNFVYEQAFQSVR